VDWIYLAYDREKLSEPCEHCTELDIQRTVHRDIFL